MMLRKMLREDADAANVLARLERSLLEFARAELNRNRAARFLDGLKLEDLAFVGVCEHGDQGRC
jgi:hypothetical protein